MKLHVGALLVAFAALAVAQSDPGPRAAASTKPAVAPSKPTPRLPDGHVDFGNTTGIWAPIWVQDWSDTKYVEKKVDVPMTAAGMKLFQERRETLSKDDPEGWCLPPGVPRYTGTPYPFQIFQMADRVVILYEGATHMYRTIFLNKEHGKDLNPTWLGESVGRYEGDALVVDTIGFNGRTWLDYVGHPASDQLHVIERYTRPNYNTLHYETTIEDPVNYSKSWTSSFNVPFRQSQELMEYVCNENNRDLIPMGTKGPK